MKTKKVILAAFAAVLCAGTCLARPHGGFHRPPPMHHHGGHHHSGWGRGGRYFWPGFVGGIVGGVLYDAVTTPAYSSTVVVQPAPVVVQQPVVVQPAPVVVQQPVVVQPAPITQNVWVEGRYVDQVQANGTTVRVWQPGHYEQRTVVAQ